MCAGVKHSEHTKSPVCGAGDAAQYGEHSLKYAEAYAAEKRTAVSNSQPHASHNQACRT